MKFYDALKECVENGKKITRTDWNGKGMYVYYMPSYYVSGDYYHHGYFCMKNAQDEIITGWLATQTDMVSDKWEIVE